jgi:hypothetical protein
MEIQYLPEQIEPTADSELQLYEYFISKNINKTRCNYLKMFLVTQRTKELITKTTQRESINLSLSNLVIV